MMERPKYFVARRSVSADRADLEHVAVITGLERNPKLPAAIVPGHDRLYRDDGFAPPVVECGLHAGLLAELDQIPRGRERQLEASGRAGFPPFAGRTPN